MSLINVNLQAFLLNCITTTTDFVTVIPSTSPISFMDLSPFILSDVNYISLADYTLSSVDVTGTNYYFTRYQSNGATYLVCEVKGSVVHKSEGGTSFYVKFSDTSFVGISGAFKIIALKHNRIMGSAIYSGSTYVSGEKRISFIEFISITNVPAKFNFRFVAVV